MNAHLSLDEDTLENDVRYSIADCRKRLRSQRATLRTQHQNPTDVSCGENGSARSIESYAEILATVSMGQSSLSRLVECLLEPVNDRTTEPEKSLNLEEALIT